VNKKTTFYLTVCFYLYIIENILKDTYKYNRSGEVKKNDIVKYNNDLNKLNMANLKEKELELFYAICCELKDRGTDEITIDITDFKKEFNISNKIDKKRFKEYIKSVHKKFAEMKYTFETEKEIETIIFFKKFKTNIEDNTMIISVNKEYSYILNNIVQYYTQFSFKEYQSLKSKYSKILMPRLAQWQGTKKVEFEKEELFDILGVSENYRVKTSNFNDKILKPIKKELPKIFYNLKVKPIKKSTKNVKNEIKSYLFTWNDRPKEIVEAEEVKTLEISKTLKTLLDEATKNSKLEILEKPSILEYLLKHYTENIIILGIKQLLTSNITTKIKTRKYITTILDQLRTKENVKIVVKEDKKTVEHKEKVEEFKRKELKEISQEEWDKIYKTMLNEALEEFKKQGTTVNTAFIEQTIKIRMKATYKIKE